MKTALILFAMSVCWIHVNGQTKDAVFLKDKSTVYGRILQLNPGKDVQINSDCCGIMTIMISKVQKIEYYPTQTTPGGVLVNAPNKPTTTQTPAKVGNVCFKNPNFYSRKIKLTHTQTKKTYELLIQASTSGCQYDLPIGTYTYEAFTTFSKIQVN